MAISKTSLKKFSKEEVVNLAFDYHSKFDSALARKRNEFSKLKKEFETPGSELAVSKGFNGMLDKRVTNMDIKCWGNSQQVFQKEGPGANGIKGIRKIRSKGEPGEC